MRFSVLLLLISFQFSACKTSDQEKEFTYSNGLINESSPYLLEHAHNPVNWYPWKEEALEKAKKENKLLVISIGYAACHWCHVMEKQSFSDTVVANLMNENFISIKVDREERPDVDDVYMSACLLSGNGHCGWPLNVFALPDGRPVWAGTYFPKKQWLEILTYFRDLYENEPLKLESYADELQSGINLEETPPILKNQNASKKIPLKGLINNFLLQADFERGGTRVGAPKFPMPGVWSSLLKYDFYKKDSISKKAIEISLEKMARGAIHDQLGGGFSRYATDENWNIPHFEKMLYDNALMISLYANAFKAYQNPFFKDIFTKNIEFIRRELTSPEGGFYASLNADSEGEEGKYYVWTEKELKSIFKDEKTFQLVRQRFGTRAGGNWELGKNTLMLAKDQKSLAEEYGISEEEMKRKLKSIDSTLFAIRSKRVKPDLDHKIVSSWNGLMVSALCDAYEALGDENYLNMASRGMEFIKSSLFKNGILYRSVAGGNLSNGGFLDDYATVIIACGDLYESSGEEKWLHLGDQLTQKALELFGNPGHPLFYYHDGKDKNLIARKTEWTDNVIPSSNALFAQALFSMGTFLSQEEWKTRAFEMVHAVLNQQERELHFYDTYQWASLALQIQNPVLEIAISGEQYLKQLNSLQATYQPDIFYFGSKGESELEILKNKFIEGQTTIYVCRDRVCRLPVTSLDDAFKLIQKERLN
ncbi:MAG: thioredoxin domain-containing protein [Saprospiraceae bacterium]